MFTPNADYVWVYVTAHTGTIHLTTDRALVTKAPYALCGKAVMSIWEVGDETVSGHVATCKTCRRRAHIDSFGSDIKAAN